MSLKETKSNSDGVGISTGSDNHKEDPQISNPQRDIPIASGMVYYSF